MNYINKKEVQSIISSLNTESETLRSILYEERCMLLNLKDEPDAEKYKEKIEANSEKLDRAADFISKAAAYLEESINNK